MTYFSRLPLVFDLCCLHNGAECFWCLCPFSIQGFLSLSIHVPSVFLSGAAENRGVVLPLICSSAAAMNANGKMPLSRDEWQSLPYQMVLNHYELKDGRPTRGELKLDLQLASIGQHNQLPLSHNLHNIFNLRHYITYGGKLSHN